MTNRILTDSAVVVVVFLVVGLSSYAADNRQGENPNLIASGPDFAIHQFKGFVESGMVESIICSGIVISHTNLKSGEMRWLVSTGVHSIPTRRISYSITRLVGLVQDEKYLIIVAYSSGPTFKQKNESPLIPDPKKGQYVLLVFSKAEGKKIYTWAFTDPVSFPEAVPQETAEAGVIEKSGKSCRVFGSVFKIDESGKVIREEENSQQAAPAHADKLGR